MSRSYHEIMERVEVTEEMRTRILGKIKSNENSSSSKNSPLSKPGLEKFWLLRTRRALPAAACFLLFILSAIFLPQLMAPKQSGPSDELLGAVGSGITECASAAELSQKLGFPVSDLHGLPFEPETVSYDAYSYGMAQITYEAASEESLTFRKSQENGDNSGDYSLYDVTLQIDINGSTVTLKGDGTRYFLAVWQADGYSYSLSSHKGMTEEMFLEIISENMN